MEIQQYLEKVPHNLEPSEYNLIKLVDCKYGKGKAHLYESNETFVDPSTFEEHLWNHYDLVESYAVSLPILEAMHRHRELNIGSHVDNMPSPLFRIRNNNGIILTNPKLSMGHKLVYHTIECCIPIVWFTLKCGMCPVHTQTDGIRLTANNYD